MSSSILVINSGSTSLKYRLFSADLSQVQLKGNFQNLKSDGHLKALDKLIKEIKPFGWPSVIGHRLVHGGGVFRQPTIIDTVNLLELKKINDLAPLHNPIQVEILEKISQLIPSARQIAVFDTSFFVNLPDRAKIYPLPLKYYHQYNVRRFGFHGLSHQYMLDQAALQLKKKAEKLNLITCHLGGGCSITAIKNGQPIDTSMGFSPLEGLVMMSRSGNIDPGLFFYFRQKLKMSFSKINQLLNFESGIKGIFGQDDFFQLLQAVRSKRNSKAQLAFDIFIYQLEKYIGAYYAILGKIDALVFSGAIGTGMPDTINQVKKDLLILRGIKIIKVLANEELVIAQKCLRFKNK
jgi:acetate kinase